MNVDFPSTENNIVKHCTVLRRLALHVSRTLKQLYSRMSHAFYQRVKLVHLAKENPDNVTRYNTRMSFLHQNTSECESVYRNGLDIQDEILKALALLYGWEDMDGHIILSTMPNCFQLLPPKELSGIIDLTDETNYEYIKQRSEMWYSVRQKFHVTASTLYRAIGLDMLQRQKEHHYIFICRRSEKPHDAELAKRLKHGTENKVNIISTLVSKIMPAFLPPCYAYFEVGPKIISHGLSSLQIEVSADGILKCTNGLECSRFSEHGDRKIVLEFKSLYATKANPNVTLYDVPQRYVPQLLCECDVWSCTEGWLLVGTPESVTGFRFYYDKTTLEALLNTAEDLYRSVKPSVPVRLHPSTNCNKEKLKTYIGTHTSFFVQCASVTGEYGNLNPSTEIKSAYAVTPNMNLGPVQHNDVDFQIAVITSESQKLFQSAHTVLQNKVTEVVVFMAANKDRVQTNSTPYTFPVAYAMKGSSMSNYDLHYMVSQVKKEFEKRQIPILCEVYDGQWHNYITTDSDGNCLTKLAWRHKWQEVMSFSKQKCIDSMVGGCRLKPGDIELLNISKRMENNKQVTFENIKVMCCIMPPVKNIVCKILTVTSEGGAGYQVPVLDKFVTVCKHSHPDLFPDKIGYSTCHSYADNECTQERPIPKPVPIQEEEHDDHTYCSKQNLTEDNRK